MSQQLKVLLVCVAALVIAGVLAALVDNPLPAVFVILVAFAGVILWTRRVYRREKPHAPSYEVPPPGNDPEGKEHES